MKSSRAMRATTFVQTDLGVQKAVNFDTIAPGSNLTYTITVFNAESPDEGIVSGPTDALNAKLTDILPSQLTFVSMAPPAGWTCTTPAVGANGTVTCNNPSFAPTTGVVFTMVAKVDPATPTSTFITNTATISSDTPDINDENDSSSAATLVSGASTDLGVNKTTTNDNAFADTDVTYTITVTNAGPDPAATGTLNDPLPNDMTFVSLSSPAGWTCTTPSAGSGGTVNCTNPSVPVTTGQTFTLVGHIPSSPGAVVYQNTATVTTTTADSNPENDDSTTTTTVVTCFTNPVVTSNADSGPGSLRQAITDACIGSTITFNTSSPITLTTGELLIDKDLAIEGPAAPLTIMRSTAGATPDFRVFTIATPRVVSISSLTISNGKSSTGGGILNNGGTLTLTNSTVSGNTSTTSGGGIWNQSTSTLHLINSTISGNIATNSGAGIFNASTATANVTNVTVSGNTGGVGFENSGTINIRNTIVAANTAGQDDVSGNFNSLGFNLIGRSPGSNGFPAGGDKVGSAAAPLNPILAILGSYGGPTKIHALLPGSPALDSGDNCVASDTCSPSLGGPLATDQRGSAFPRAVGSRVDIGAFESRGFTVTATGGTPQSATISTAFSSPLVATVGSAFGEPVGGGNVTFTAPGSGASGSFPGPSLVSIMSTTAGGVATSATITANATPGSYNVVASVGTGATANFSLTNLKINQTINFAAIADKAFGDPDFNVNATATSGLAVTYAASGQCTVSGSGIGTVHITAPGSCTITASQAGDGSYNAATPVARSFNISTAATSTAVGSSLNPSNLGQSVTFTATVTSSAGTPTGTVQFKDGATNIGAAVALNGSGVATVATSTLTAGVHTITAVYSGATNFATSTGTLSPNQTVNNRPLISLSQATYSVNESSNFVTITVNRSGDTSSAVTVDYATQDDSGPSSAPCTNGGGLASSRCDFISAFGTLRFAATETQKTFVVLITQDTFIEGPEIFTLALSNPNGGGAAFATPSNATVTINESPLASPPNAIDDTTIFVRQQYHDFLNREPDSAGLTFWTNQINSCGSDAQCIDVKRINVSAAFFLSIEFQQSGGLVRNAYVATLNRPATNNMPAFVEFERDTQAIQNGVIIGQPGAQALLDANRTAFLNDFVTRAEYVGLYPTTDTPAQYVDKVYLHAAITPTTTERNNAIAEFGSAPTAADAGARGRVLLRVTQNTTFQTREMNPSFVQMEYLGYLRRNPNDPPDSNFNGYNFWLNKLNAFNGNFVNAEMVKAFISSPEYRHRFGQ